MTYRFDPKWKTTIITKRKLYDDIDNSTKYHSLRNRQPERIKSRETQEKSKASQSQVASEMIFTFFPPLFPSILSPIFFIFPIDRSSLSKENLYLACWWPATVWRCSWAAWRGPPCIATGNCTVFKTARTWLNIGAGKEYSCVRTMEEPVTEFEYV